ncbi:hypothetical protein [Paenibacillus sp.]|uniref:hypothetical protein n=1 Tax=Paenibacillus sp. TaxID=58172 RepID=UPI00282C6857|nr:hypothetical protein [Paenibacillus sp.]MDR0269524.1 hypothetical protein [Paenibacillus sp.]
MALKKDAKGWELSTFQFDFEAAAKFRDVLQSIRFLEQKEKVIGFAGSNPNVLLYEPVNKETIKLFLVKRNTILFSRNFSVATDQERQQLAKEAVVLVQAYFKNDESAYTSEVFREEIDEAQIIFSYVQSHPGQVALIPDVWLDMDNPSELNAALALLFSDIPKETNGFVQTERHRES